jgi:hypothetical protein
VTDGSPNGTGPGSCSSTTRYPLCDCLIAKDIPILADCVASGLQSILCTLFAHGLCEPPAVVQLVQPISEFLRTDNLRIFAREFGADHPWVIAEPITDGILIPWSNGPMKGTLWAVSHSSDEAFDVEDYSLLSSLSDFAAIILRPQHQQEFLRQREKAIAGAEMAHKIAHRINNPLQSLTNTIFLARHDESNAKEYLVQGGG